MSYIEENLLNPGESILFVPEKSRIKLFWNWFGGILFFWFFLIPLFYAIKYAIEFKYVEYAVTDKKVIVKFGWTHTSCNEMQLSHIENIRIHQRLSGKMFHYGTVVVRGTNRDDIYFHDVKNPELVRKQINQLIPEDK